MDPGVHRRMRTAHLNHKTVCACGRVLHGNGAKSHLRSCKAHLQEIGWPLASTWVATFVDAGLPGAETSRQVERGLGQWALTHLTPTGRVTQPDSLPWQQFKELIWRLAEPIEEKDMPTTTAVPMLPEHAVKAIKAWRKFDTGHAIGRITPGGTYIISTAPAWTDSGKPNDLLAILPSDLGQGRVLKLWLAVNPAFVEFVEKIIEEKAEVPA